jgi:hypothetical protein
VYLGWFVKANKSRCLLAMCLVVKCTTTSPRHSPALAPPRYPLLPEACQANTTSTFTYLSFIFSNMDSMQHQSKGHISISHVALHVHLVARTSTTSCTMRHSFGASESCDHNRSKPDVRFMSIVIDSGIRFWYRDASGRMVNSLAYLNRNEAEVDSCLAAYVLSYLRSRSCAASSTR